MRATIEIYRYNPDTNESGFDTFEKDVNATDRILDVLIDIKDNNDGSLAFRRSCNHGVCGSDAMQINGINRLACQVLIQDLKSNRIRIQPIKGMRVLKDLIVDMDPFFESLEKVKPFFIPGDPNPAEGERLQSIADRAIFDDTTKCIMCAACTTSCPSFWFNSDYLGPAALVKAHRFVFDSRDQGNAQRMEVITDANGLWRCHSIYNCTDACPREISITLAISQLKKRAVLGG